MLPPRQRHAGHTYRLGYDVKSYGEVAQVMSEVLGQPFRYDAQSPDVFLENMRAAGAEMAYMRCVHDNFTRMAAGAIPGVDQVFDNFQAITGREPVRTWLGRLLERRRLRAWRLSGRPGSGPQLPGPVGGSRSRHGRQWAERRNSERQSSPASWDGK